MPRITAALLLVLAACDKDDTDDTGEIGTTPVCDGIQQLEEETTDAPFDQDGDGFFDADDPDCAANLSPDRLDCDDSDPEVRPGAVEFPCNGIDDDCNPASPDESDNDGDGVGSCTDCNDATALISPEADEVCFDDIDNDCDGIQDNDCGEDYNGFWTMTEQISHSCSFLGIPVYTMEFDSALVLWNPPFLTISNNGTGNPGGMDGTVEPDGSFTVNRSVGGALGTCIESYTMTGSFTSADTMTAAFTYELVPTLPGACSGCTIQATTVEFEATKDSAP